MVQVNIDLAAVDDLLNGDDGPVGMLIAELSEKAAGLARMKAPVMERLHWSELHQYGPPGETKRSVRASGFRHNAFGQLYSGVNVNYGPTLFLQRPARQIRTEQYMFMSQALDALTL